ncbi:MAG: hypothetical protein RL528_1799 [Bacteroidota bacterium]
MNELMYYMSLLKAFTSLTKLFSDSGDLYLEYRAMENIFCNSFHAVNLAREDGAFDAKIGNRGYGLKTFGIKDKSLEKVAEFNKHSTILRDIKSNEELVYKLAELRNARISTAVNLHCLTSYIYHCIGRHENRLVVFETEYPLICTKNISHINRKNTSLTFRDGKHEYNFNFSKSTLFKRFSIEDSKIIQEIDVSILKDPYSAILQISDDFSLNKKMKNHEFVVLPLYSTRKTPNKIVYEKSGLNQWNAGGRNRKYGEIYIPIPADVYKISPNFFPNRDTNFNLKTPDGTILNAKICQESSKALMTNPNNAMSEWLLRRVFKLKEYELLTYENLLCKGYDSVQITKIDDLNFEITLAAIDEYEAFLEKFI